MLGIAASLALVSAEGAFADGLPGSPATPTAPTAPPVAAAPTPAAVPTPAATPSSAPAPTVVPLILVVVVPVAGAIPLPANPLPPFSGTPAPQPLTDGLAQLGVGVKGALNQIGAGMAGTPLAPLAPSGAPAGVAAVAVHAAPVATLCVQSTGTGTAWANLDLFAFGGDIGTPLIQTFPGVLAPCPTPPRVQFWDTKPPTILRANLNRGTLLDVCVRSDGSVVPCPGGPSSGPGGPSSGPGGPSSGPGGGGAHSHAGSAFPTVGSLPFTGVEIALLLAFAAALIAAGILMVRKPRSNHSSVSI